MAEELWTNLEKPTRASVSADDCCCCQRDSLLFPSQVVLKELYETVSGRYDSESGNSSSTEVTVQGEEDGEVSEGVKANIEDIKENAEEVSLLLIVIFLHLIYILFISSLRNLTRYVILASTL
jgi:hypothetical protein